MGEASGFGADGEALLYVELVQLPERSCARFCAAFGVGHRYGEDILPFFLQLIACYSLCGGAGWEGINWSVGGVEDVEVGEGGRLEGCGEGDGGEGVRGGVICREDAGEGFADVGGAEGGW